MAVMMSIQSFNREKIPDERDELSLQQFLSI
jgi:hypothetical protein